MKHLTSSPSIDLIDGVFLRVMGVRRMGVFLRSWCRMRMLNTEGFEVEDGGFSIDLFHDGLQAEDF
jgi:pyrimidine operon attenuation protein/uracil phosphoribosyltransferase